MTWKFIYTYRERRKTGPAHNRCWNWSHFTSKDTWMRFSKFWNTFPEVSKLTAWISWPIASLSCSIVRGVFLYTLPFNRPQRSRQVLDRLPIVSNLLTNFWMQHFDDARLSPNSFRNAICHALNEPVCQYLRTRNPRCSTVYIENSLGPLARDSSCIIQNDFTLQTVVVKCASNAGFVQSYLSGWSVNAANEMLTFQSPHIKVPNSVQEYIAMISTEFVQDNLGGRNVHSHLRHKFPHEVQCGSTPFRPVSASNAVPPLLNLIRRAWSIFWPYDRSWNKKTNKYYFILGHYIVLSGSWLSPYSNAL